MHILRNTLMMGLISSGVVLAPLLTRADDTTRNEELVGHSTIDTSSGTDTFLIKDGKIIAQTLAAKARPEVK